MKIYAVQMQRIYSLEIVQRVMGESEDDARKVAERNLRSGVFDSEFADKMRHLDPIFEEVIESSEYEE